MRSRRTRAAYLFLLAQTCLAGQCRPITSQDGARFEAFVGAWYRIGTGQHLTLIDSTSVDAFCYRKLVFRSSAPAPLLTLYLTPDGKHLVTGVMDMTVDPVIAQRKLRQELADKLSSRASVTNGPDSAPLKMVVFSDFQCPYCKQFAETMQQLTPDERARLQIIYRQLPLSMHPWARDAAALTTCVALQDKSAFWKLHDFLFAHQQELSKETLRDKAIDFLSQEASIDTTAVSACLSHRSFEDHLHQDEQLAIDLGIRSTPSVFLNGRRIAVRSIDDLRNALHTAEKEDAPPDQPSPKAANENSTACLRQSDAQCRTK